MPRSSPAPAASVSAAFWLDVGVPFFALPPLLLLSAPVLSLLCPVSPAAVRAPSPPLSPRPLPPPCLVTHSSRQTALHACAEAWHACGPAAPPALPPLAKAPNGAACFMWAGSPLGGVGLVPLACVCWKCRWGPEPVKNSINSQIFKVHPLLQLARANQRSSLSRTPSPCQDHNRMRKPKVSAVALAERRRSAIEAQTVISTATSSRSFKPSRSRHISRLVH